MAYNLHICRDEATLTEAERVITEQEWQAVVSSDKSLLPEPSPSVTNPKTQEVISVDSPSMASWIDQSTQQKYYFHYSSVRGEIQVRNPPDQVIKKMKQIAAQLKASVIGDEGEVY